MPGGSAYGCYGKVPCVGDFVRRGLSPQFVAQWDRWMQDLLLAGQAALADRWQDCYLTAPIWRFALSAGVCGPQAVAGVMMPSVDRVGRRFPLCIAAELEGAGWAAALAVAPVIEHLEDAALSMLDEDATLATLDQRLAALPAPARVTPAGAAPPDAAPSVWTTVAPGDTRVLFAAPLPQGAQDAAALFDAGAPCWPPAADLTPLI